MVSQHPDEDVIEPFAGDERDYEPHQVNAWSSISDPKKKFPAHYAFLKEDLRTAGELPERWKVIDAMETRTTANGTEVEFTLVRHGTDLIWHRAVVVMDGKLAGVRTA
jgi:hypothetical protein